MSGDLSFYHHKTEEILQQTIVVCVDETLAEGSNDFIKLTEKLPEESESKSIDLPIVNFQGFYLLE